MPADPLTLSWSDVFKYAWRSLRESWTTLLTGTVVISALSILYPWGSVYHFSESGWDEVMGGSAVWSLLAIPTWLAGAALWHLMRAPVGRARDILAMQNATIGALNDEIAALCFELDRERAASPVFGEAVMPRTVEDRLIRLADLPPGLWLSKRTFKRCQFLGPAKVLFSGGTSDFDVVIVTEPEGGYSVFVPELPSVATQGETIEEAWANAQEAIEEYLEVMHDGLTVPTPIATV